jgi:uncharacterized protein (TIGR02172 family)
LEKHTLIGRGRTADVYAWGEGRILKLFQDWIPAFVAEREFIITRTAQAAGVPVPATYELIEINGRHGIVFERIEGISLLTEIQNKPWKMITFARQLGELHAKIHEVRAPVELPAQKKQIADAIESINELSEDDRQTVQSYLNQMPEGQSLCHGDFHPDNILLSTRGPIIIDWLTGSRGHPLADVARTSLLIHTAALPPRTPAYLRLILDTSRALLFTIYIKRYFQLCPGKRQQIEKWRLPLIAARIHEVDEYPQEKQLLLSQLKAVMKEQQR